MNKTKANGAYMLMHFAMWCVYAILMSFATNFLEAHGVGKVHTSVILGVTAAASCLLQIASGELVNRIARLKMYVLFFLADVLLAAGCTMMLGGDTIAVAGIVIGCTLAQTITAYANAVGMDAAAKGAPVDFGMARGAGSFAYATSNIVIGALASDAYLGIKAIPLVSLVILLVLIGAIAWFHITVENKLPQTASTEKIEKRTDSFFKSNPMFCIYLLGAVLLCASHYLLCSYIQFIIESVGGGRVEQGIANGISAYVELPIMFGFAWLARKIRCDKLLRFSAIMFLAKGLGLYFAPNIGWIYATQATQMVGYGLYAIASVHYAGKVVPDDAVRAQSYLAATITTGSVLAMSVGGVLCEAMGVKAMILFGTASALIGAVIVFFSTRKTITES